MLLHHVGKDDVAVPARSGQLGAIDGPGNGKNAASVGLLQGIRPLEKEKKIIIKVILYFLEDICRHEHICRVGIFEEAAINEVFIALGLDV